MMTQPSRPIFWRFIFTSLAIFVLLAMAGLIERSRILQVSISESRTWQAIFLLLGIFFIATLVGIISTFFKTADRLWEWFDTLGQTSRAARWIGILASLIGLFGFAFISWNPFFKRILRGEDGPRFLVLFLISLVGMWGIKLLRRQTPWLVALIGVVLFQAVLQLLLVYLPRVTTYPFAMGWSETSRFYFPSLFVSDHVYGQKYPWPILHPTLHLLLAPPYLFDAPLWIHRLWQVVIRYALIAAMVPPLLMRMKIQQRAIRWLAGIWMFLFLFMGPVYFHLAVPVILVLLGFSLQNERRAWIVVLLASIWCGWSRVNWYPMPGMIAAVLYLMEAPVDGKSLGRYLWKPALWFVVGILVAFLSQKLYVLLSGLPSTVFYTSLTSDLLWNRLWPNASYSLGVIPAALLASLPAWLVMYVVVRARRSDWHPVRLLLILAALLVLFIGGIIVSLKIGGGANLHNMDAYFTMLWIVLAYLVFARYIREEGDTAQPVTLPWLLIVLLILMPAWAYLQFNLGLKVYDSARTGSVLADLQHHVDDANTRGGEVLFVTQRQLISMHMLKGVTLVPEYEREDLMEMAMGNNVAYLDRFRKDMEDQRFALIVVDPLTYKILPGDRAFSEENNVWVRRVMKSILCNYRQEALYEADEIALYVPQQGTRQCP